MKSKTIYSLQSINLAQNAAFETQNAVLTTLAKLFPEAVQENLHRRLITTKVFVVNEKKSFVPKSSCVVKKAASTTLPETFRSKNYNKSKTFHFCPQKSPKMYLLTCTMKFWQQCWNIFCHSQLSFRSKSKKCEPKKDFKLIYFPWKRWSGHAESCFEKPATFFRKNSISFRSTSEEVGKV